MSLDYLAVIKEGDTHIFTWDQKLGFDLFTNQKCSWGTWENIVDHNWTLIDEVLDVSDIPPSLLFMAIINTYSRGFSLYVPLDMSLWLFSDAVAQQIKAMLESSTVTRPIIHETRFSRSHVDLETLNRQGIIASTSQWNRVARTHICHESDGTLQCTGSIQGIVRQCRDFLRKATR